MRIFKLNVLLLCIACLVYLFTTTVTAVSSDTDNQSIRIPQNNTQLRDKPSTDGDIIYFADEEEEFDIASIHQDWYKVTNKSATGFVLKQLVKKERPDSDSANPLDDKTIVIDAGHGGQDVGAIGTGGIFEKNITYKTAIELKQKLVMLGANAVFTRQGDKYISLSSRAGLSNISADAFISIHYNSAPESPDVSGIGTYYYQQNDKDMAEMIQQEVIKVINGEDRGTAFGDFQVLRQNFKPAVLVELGFISHPEEERLLLTNAYQQRLVSGVINGMEKYFSSESKK